MDDILIALLILPLLIFVIFLVLGTVAVFAPIAMGKDRWMRVKTRVNNLPWLLAILKWKRSKPPIFGERHRPKSPDWQDIPEWVLDPKFSGLAKPVRTFLSYVWFVLILFPYLFNRGTGQFYSLVLGFKEYIEQQPLDERDMRPETLYRYAGTGKKVLDGIDKGNKSELRQQAQQMTDTRHDAVLEEYRDMLAEGISNRNLVAEYVTRHGSEYSERQLRRIKKNL